MSDVTSNVEVKVGSERSFGLVFAAVFLIVALFPLLNGGGLRLWALGLCAIMAVIAFVAPRLLRAPNRLWFKLGMLLGAIVAPIVMLGVFVFAFLPIGLLMRLFRYDPLNRRLDRTADSYWIIRKDQPGPMTNQF